MAGVSCVTAEGYYTSAQSLAEVKLGICKSGDTISNDGMVNRLLSDLAYSLTKRSCQTGAMLFPSSQALIRLWYKDKDRVPGCFVPLFAEGQWLAVGQGSAQPWLLRGVPLNHIQHNPSPLLQTLPGGSVSSGLSNPQERLLLLRHPKAVLPAVGCVRLWDPTQGTACTPVHLPHLTAHQGWAVALSPAAGHRDGSAHARCAPGKCQGWRQKLRAQ